MFQTCILWCVHELSWDLVGTWPRPIQPILEESTRALHRPAKTTRGCRFLYRGKLRVVEGTGCWFVLSLAHVVSETSLFALLFAEDGFRSEPLINVCHVLEVVGACGGEIILPFHIKHRRPRMQRLPPPLHRPARDLVRRRTRHIVSVFRGHIRPLLSCAERVHAGRVLDRVEFRVVLRGTRGRFLGHLK